MNDGSKITLYDEDNNPIELYVVEETKINNVSYLLVTEGEEDDAEAFILKDSSNEDDPEAVYSFVEDDAEIEYIGKIFTELLDENDIELL